MTSHPRSLVTGGTACYPSCQIHLLKGKPETGKYAAGMIHSR